ncbi:hypothetical protein NQ318_007756 [Aromia moschata]|uniref:Uncharacterized protein n=1 Tax=Aromia moschata TaxID=1265417 RepID=A0AAV8YZR6_9CUCU|nr:hypothetical protein NQ318_007756 [Aromia moschata]
MASRQVFLKDLKVADLKRELEERECETTGKKADLQNRLREALENEGENPNTYLFDIAGDINSALQSLEKNLEEKLLENATQMQQKLEETSGNLRGMEQKLVENSSNLRGMEQNLRGMEQKLIENGSNLQQKLEETSGKLENLDKKLLENYTTLEKKIMENSSCLQKQIGEYVDGKFEEIENKLVTVEEFQNKFLEVERKIATLNLESGEQQRVVNTALKSPGSDIDRLSKPELSSPVEISKIRMKPPQFDGKSSWVNYLRQFEAAARANGWSLAEKATALTLALHGDATDILQTLSLEEQDDYHQLVKHLEMRYGQSHLEHVYHSQLKNRYQKSNESLQEFEADIARLVRLAYSSTPENVMERLAVQAFLDGLRDTETRQALTLARPSKLVDALARALEFEAAKESCRRQATIRKREEDLEEGTCNEAEIRRVAKEILDKRPIRRWNGAKVRHIRGRRIEKKKAPPSSEKDVVIRRLTVVNDDWQPDELLRDQGNDPNLKPIVNWKKEGRKPTWEEVSRYSPTVKSYWAQWNSLVLSDGLLKRVLEKSDVHETTGQTPASIVMGRELRLPCDLKFGCTPGEDVAGEDYVSTLRQRMDDIHERVRSNIQGASNRMKETYDINANDGRYQPGNQVWLYNPQRRRGLSPKLQSSWEGPYEVVTRINDVVYRIQKLPRGKPRVVHFNRLAPFAGSNDEQAEARVRHVSPPDSELSFEEFMLLHSNGQKARYGVTREEPRDLFQTPADFCLAHCVAADLRMSRGIALTFKKAFGQLEELRRQRPEVGRVLQITAAEQEKERSVFYLVTKQLSHHKPTYQAVWDTLVELRDVLLSQSISSLAIPKIASGLDGLDWRVIRSMLEVLFRFTGIEILVCCYNPRRSLNEKTVDCFFYQTSRCKNGPRCRYRHGPEDDGTIRDEMSLRRGQCGEITSSVRRRPVDRGAAQVLFGDTAPRCVSPDDIREPSSERALDRAGTASTVREDRSLRINNRGFGQGSAVPILNIGAAFRATL